MFQSCAIKANQYLKSDSYGQTCVIGIQDWKETSIYPHGSNPKNCSQWNRVASGIKKNK